MAQTNLYIKVCPTTTTTFPWLVGYAKLIRCAIATTTTTSTAVTTNGARVALTHKKTNDEIAEN